MNEPADLDKLKINLEKYNMKLEEHINDVIETFDERDKQAYRMIVNYYRDLIDRTEKEIKEFKKS